MARRNSWNVSTHRTNPVRSSSSLSCPAVAEGISIPASYTSFIAPVSSEKLHNEVVGLGKELKHFETPYVQCTRFYVCVFSCCSIDMLSNYTILMSWVHHKHGKNDLFVSVKMYFVSCLSHFIHCSFTFVHPTPQPADNSRYTALRFPTMKRSSLIHGFSGYFDATLYGQLISVSLSLSRFRFFLTYFNNLSLCCWSTTTCRWCAL